MEAPVLRIHPNSIMDVHSQIPAFSCDDHFVNFRYWDFFSGMEKQLPLGAGIKKKVISLKHANLFSPPVLLEKKSLVSLKNDTRFKVCDLSVFSVEAQKEVFFWKEIPKNESVDFEFLKEGSYHVHYSLPQSELEKVGTLKIVVPLNFSHSKHFNLPSL